MCEELRLYVSKVKFLRNVKGLSQEDVAKKIGLANKNSFGNFEQGSRFLSRERIKKLSDLLGENLEDENIRELVNKKIRDARNKYK